VAPTVVEVLVAPEVGDYESLSELAADAQDILAANEQWNVTCATFEDTAPVDFDGWVTDPTRFLRVAAEEPHGSVGVITEDSYRLVVSSDTALKLTDVGEGGSVKLRGLQVAGVGQDALYLHSEGRAEVSGCV